MIRRLRLESQVPIVLYVYYNILHRYGIERWITDCATVGVDGLLVLDLPPEESGDYETQMVKAGLSVIYLMAPTTTIDRMELIAKGASGFIYYVSREGVTGMQNQVATNIGTMTARIRAHTDLPIAVGFGISNPEQARHVASFAEAIVVGSAVVNQIATHGQDPDLVTKVVEFVRPMVAAIKS